MMEEEWRKGVKERKEGEMAGSSDGRSDWKEGGREGRKEGRREVDKGRLEGGIVCS